MTKIVTIELLDVDDFDGWEWPELLEQLSEGVADTLSLLELDHVGVSLQYGSPDDPRGDGAA